MIGRTEVIELEVTNHDCLPWGCSECLIEIEVLEPVFPYDEFGEDTYDRAYTEEFENMHEVEFPKGEFYTGPDYDPEDERNVPHLAGWLL